MGMAGSCASLYLLLGASGVGKTLLVKRLQNIRGSRAELQRWCQEPWRATSYIANGTNLADLSVGKKITIRELGGCMGPIWSSYYSDCHAVLLDEHADLVCLSKTWLCDSSDIALSEICRVKDPLSILMPGPGNGGDVKDTLPMIRDSCLPRGYMIDAANPTQISSSCVQLLSLLSSEQLTSVPVLLIFNKIDLPCYMSLVEMKSLIRIQDIIACAKQAITVIEISARDGRGLSDVMQWFQSTLRD